MDNKKFFKAFLKNPRQTGSVIQSSPFLVRKIVEPIDFENAKCIVELGAGTGVVTKKILENMPKDCVLVCFEVDKGLCKKLKKNLKDRRLKVVSDGAEKMDRYLASHKEKKIDFVVSELPLVSLPKETGEKILSLTKENLKTGGQYIQIQYSLVGRERLKKIFPKMAIKFTLFNIPPSFVYVCTKE